MVDPTDPATLIGKRDRLALVLVLVLGLAMMGNAPVALDLADVTETDDGPELVVRASKTDQDAVARWWQSRRSRHYPPELLLGEPRPQLPRHPRRILPTGSG